MGTVLLAKMSTVPWLGLKISTDGGYACVDITPTLGTSDSPKYAEVDGRYHDPSVFELASTTVIVPF